jgi:hypothetical protein
MTARTKQPIPTPHPCRQLGSIQSTSWRPCCASVTWRVSTTTTAALSWVKFSNVTGKQFDADRVQENFWHEITHAILHDMGEDKLNNNEKFVVEFSKRLSTSNQVCEVLMKLTNNDWKEVLGRRLNELTRSATYQRMMRKKHMKPRTCSFTKTQKTSFGRNG